MPGCRHHVAVVVLGEHERPVLAHKTAPLDGDRVRHDDSGAIAENRRHEGQTNPLVAARGLDDDAALMEPALPFRLADHTQGGTSLDGASHVHGLVLYEHARHAGANHPVEAHEWRMSHGLKYALIYHRPSIRRPPFCPLSIGPYAGYGAQEPRHTVIRTLRGYTRLDVTTCPLA